MYLEDTLVVDQEVIDMVLTADIYYVLFGFEAQFDMTMDWGSRINLTWCVLPHVLSEIPLLQFLLRSIM